jgi:superfamily I DNA and RNA helicase
MTTLYELVRQFDRLLGQQADKKPDVTVQTFTQILFETRGLSTKGKPTPKTKLQKKQEKAQKLAIRPKLTDQEIQQLAHARLIIDKINDKIVKFDSQPPPYNQCQNKQTKERT